MMTEKNFNYFLVGTSRLAITKTWLDIKIRWLLSRFSHDSKPISMNFISFDEVLFSYLWWSKTNKATYILNFIEGVSNSNQSQSVRNCCTRKRCIKSKFYWKLSALKHIHIWIICRICKLFLKPFHG